MCPRFITPTRNAWTPTAATCSEPSSSVAATQKAPAKGHYSLDLPRLKAPTSHSHCLNCRLPGGSTSKASPSSSQGGRAKGRVLPASHMRAHACLLPPMGPPRYWATCWSRMAPYLGMVSSLSFYMWGWRPSPRVRAKD